MRVIALATGASGGHGRRGTDRPVLDVYTYDSFVTEWGPGPAIETAFEADCGCDLRFVAAGDGAALLARLRLEGARTDADVVLGLDTNLTAAAAETGLFAPHGIDADFDLPVAWDDPLFLPYDWGYFAFVYDRARLADPPENFRALAASDVSIIIAGPAQLDPGPRPAALGQGRLRRRGGRRSGRGSPTTSSPSPRAGPRPTACSSTARPTWCSPTPPRPPTT